MTRWRHLVGVIAICGLAGCLDTGLVASSGDGTAKPGGPEPLARAELAHGDVVVAGPDGYCVDPVTLSSRSARDFAVIASCNIIAGGQAGMFVEPMMMTVTVGIRLEQPVLPAPGALAVEAGQGMVAGSTRDGMVSALLAGGGAEVLADGDPRYWRGAFVLNGHLIGLALYAPRGSYLAGEDGRAMMQAVRQRIVALSPDQESPADVQ